MGGEVRNYANAQLVKINQSTLTNEEAELLPVEFDKNLIFSALAKVINLRGATGNNFRKLKALATLEGVEIAEKQNKRSDVLIGLAIE